MKNILRDLSTAGQNYLATGEVPSPKRQAPQSLADAIDTVLGIASWAGTAAGVAGVLVTGVMMAVSVKGGQGQGSEHMSRLGMVMGGCVLVSTAGPIVTFFFSQ
ncbi:hypothetical protein OIE75_32325 [Streptomyces sp. NBC_01723]|uniref:hypothetical protein n=1 Tax=Streptomyces sp. NBC_01723 TaxID=2975921 RepID=UPI002E34F145|nr:hypothetical protein [Streptomyces sp. NBC_01723]